MKSLIILKEFYDKYTNELYLKDSIIEFDNKRADEIMNNPNNLAEIVDIPHTSKATKKPSRRTKKAEEVCGNE